MTLALHQTVIYSLSHRSNRVAYRRGIMTRSTVLKDTLDEFNGMVSAGVMGEDEEENEYDFDDFLGGGGGKYSEAEVTF